MFRGMTLLQKRDRARRQRRLEVYVETRRRLHAALADLIPGRKVIVFGSLTKAGVFNDHSDVDVALVDPPMDLDGVRLTAELMERLARPVDVLRLDQCRFRERIQREGEVWTL
jgi:predicted nucleotidyltransferase